MPKPAQPNSRGWMAQAQPQRPDGESRKATAAALVRFWASRFQISRLPLTFQERIWGPENASIARFDGLCCYQNRSGKGGGFQQAARGGSYDNLEKNESYVFYKEGEINEIKQLDDTNRLRF